MARRAGSRNTRLVIQTPSVATDELGQPIEVWTDFADAWANVKHLNGTETIKAGAVTSILNASIRIDYRTDLNAGMRVLVGTTVYQIKVVVPDMQRREYVDLVSELVQ